MKKKLSLILSMILLCSAFFIGCNKEGLEIIKAFEKNQKINAASYEGKVNFDVDVLKSNTQQKDALELADFFPMYFNVAFNGKSIVELEKEIKQEMNLQYDLMDIKTNSKIISSTTINKDKTNTEVFIEMPVFVKNLLGLGKSEAKYLYYSDKLAEEYMKSLGVTEETPYKMDKETLVKMQSAYINLLNKIAANVKENAKLAKSLGNENQVINGVTKSLKMYEITLNKKNMESLLTEIFKDEKLVKEFFEIAFMVYPEEMKISLMKEIMSEYNSNKDAFIKEMKGMFQVIGDKSLIKIKLGVDNGYIAYEKVNLNMYIMELYNVKLEVEEKIFDINSKDIKIELPKSNSKDCVNLFKQIEKLEKSAGETYGKNIESTLDVIKSSTIN